MCVCVCESVCVGVCVCMCVCVCDLLSENPTSLLFKWVKNASYKNKFNCFSKE